MKNTNWIINQFGNFLSNHILVSDCGEPIEKFHVLKNPEGEGWVIGQFYPFIGEYAPLEEEGEERLIFETAETAMKFVDTELNS